jgi:hypothetical protein
MAGDLTPLPDLRNRPTAEEGASQNLSVASQGLDPLLQSDLETPIPIIIVG